MKRLRKERNLLVGVSSLIFLLVAVVITLLWVTKWDQEPISSELDTEVNVSAIEQIINYESTRTKKHSAVGASKPKVAIDSPHQGDISRNVNVNSYDDSIVSVVKNVRKGRMEADGTENSKSTGEINNHEWLNTSSSIDTLLQQAGESNRNWTFGWIQLKYPLQSKQIEEELRRFGASVLGQTGNLIRAKVPKNRKPLEAIAQLSWVSGLGALPPTQKLGSELEEMFEDNIYSTQIPVFIVVTSSKMEDMFRGELTKIGLVVGHFDASIRTFSAVLRSNQLAELVNLDFVQAVEPITEVIALNDSVIPAIGGDALRDLGNDLGVYTGINGRSTPIGFMDTGLNTNHVALSSWRKSICGRNFVEGEDHDLWTDKGGHGSHVFGTIAGNGYFQPKYAGVAPGVEHIRVAKVLSTRGEGNELRTLQGMDFLAESTSCPAEGWTADSVKPLIVNMSLASDSLVFDGRTTGPRKLDSIVWTHRQLYVVANSNRNLYGYSNYGSAKNSLAVGAAYDNGDITFFSSRGPTVDGRLQPSLVGPGSIVFSTRGDGSYDGYSLASGTSVSSPVVAGVAALLMDASPEHREEPALVRARLMASAVRPDAWFDSEIVFPTNNTNGPGTEQTKYGMGLISARTSVSNHDVPEGWTRSGATLTLENGEYAFQDIVVPVGTTRLDVVMTWDEPPTDSIASTVLNDLNLWIDYGADCQSEPCGEYSSQSKIDTVEWVIIQDPEPGTYRIKVSGDRIFTEPPRAGVAWTMIRGPATPQLTVAVDQTTFEVENGEDHNHSVEVTVSTNGYVAAGTELYVDCRTAENKPCESFGFVSHVVSVFTRRFSGFVQREDGFGTYYHNDQSMYLGEVGHGEEQRVRLQLASESSGPLTIYLTATAWNATSDSVAVVFRESRSDTEPYIETQPKLNDTYETPTVLDSQGGVLEIDTLLATSEPGEPQLGLTGQRPTRSLWFQWTAERSGLVSFVVAPRDELPSWYLESYLPILDVYIATGYCCGIASAQYVTISRWSVQFFAEQGKEYRIRVSGAHASMPMTLNWIFGERPPNDYFADAITLTGASGSVPGYNLGATIEPGEVYGTLASTIWYRWTAPADGDWEFQIEDAQVVHLLVFVGDTIDDLRLVSGISAPGEPVSVATVQDETYHIMVASPNAFSGGWKFDDLSWELQTEARSGWDWFDLGLQLVSTESGSVSLAHEGSLGVEPDEPETTGIQTGWLKWIAPEDGRYTWYWDNPEFQLRSFSGNSVGELNVTELGANLVVVSGGREFVLDAVTTDEYVISVGRAKDNNQAYTYSESSTHTELRWGKTPTNNWISGAISLSGSEGNVLGLNQFATTGSSFRTHLGYSSLWYSYEAEESGWFKFWIEGASSTSILSAFHPSESNLNPERIMVSRTTRIPGEGVEVTVYIERGSTVLLRVGSTRAHSSSEFKLHWSATDPPNWLIYRGRVAEGRRDAAGQVISSLSGLADMALNSDGTFLFASTDAGVSVFQREPTTGNLSLTQEINEPDPQSFLFWDPYRERLYVHNQDTWWSISFSSDDSSEFVLDRTEYGIGPITDNKDLGSPVLFMGNNGDYLYRSMRNEQSIYSFNSDSTFKFIGNNSVESAAVYPSINGNYWWRWHVRDVQLLERKVGSGSFQQISKEFDASGWREVTGTFLDKDEYFFATSIDARPRAYFSIYSIDDGKSTLKLSTEAQIDNLSLTDCAAAIPRKGSYAVDVLCWYGAYVVEYLPESGEVSLSDYLLNFLSSRIVPDRFGRRIPSYWLSRASSGSSSVEASPDGLHIYVATNQHGILIFERLGNETTDLTDPETLPVRRLDLLQASKNQIQFNNDIAENGCITASDWVVDNVSYSVLDSKWQQRSIDSSWSDIEGTEEIGRLCSYSPTDSKDYRMVATFTRDDETIEFASNFFGDIVYERLSSLTVESDEVNLDTLSITECTEISDLVVNGVNYSVKESKWQVRDDSEVDWSDIASTVTAGELCPYDPNDSREYRLVGRFVIDDEEDYYSSNVLQEESDEN